MTSAMPVVPSKVGTGKENESAKGEVSPSVRKSDTEVRGDTVRQPIVTEPGASASAGTQGPISPPKARKPRSDKGRPHGRRASGKGDGKPEARHPADSGSRAIDGGKAKESPTKPTARKPIWSRLLGH